MYVELCMEFGKTEINFQQSSNLQGVIMENISTEYAGILHGNQLNPYSQYVSKEENGVVWHISDLNPDKKYNFHHA